MSNHFNFLIKRIRSFSQLDPERDWIILLIASGIALTGIIVWNAWIFDTIATGGVIGSPMPNATPVFNQSSLDAIHTIFTSRAREEANYVSDVYHYIDPSQ